MDTDSSAASGQRRQNHEVSITKDLASAKRDCGLGCPLREPKTYHSDPPLPPTPRALPLSRKEACTRLYKAIKPWQTRLLVVEPSEFGSDIFADLVVVDIVHLYGAVLHERQEHVQYTALSYAWGAEAFPRLIEINGIPYPVTENLYGFLQRHRNCTHLCYLWVDAICINQFDLEEKATQVSYMLAIFERAEQVIVWLGEEGSNTKIAVDYLRWFKASGAITSKITNRRHAIECFQLTHEVLRGVEDICTRNWVRRIWVKQEVWAAKRLVVYCGTSKLCWGEYLRALNTAIKPATQILETLTNGHHGREAFPLSIPAAERKCLRNLGNQGDHARSQIDLLEGEHDAHDILRLLNESTDCQTTNEHDRIYALLGMAGVVKSGVLKARVPPTFTMEINYNITLELLYRTLAMSIMLYAGLYSILATNGTFGQCEDLNLPSWTPDFRHAVRCKLPKLWRPTIADKISADQGTQDDFQIRRLRALNLDVRCPVLRVEGHRIATITTPKVLTSQWDLYPIALAHIRASGAKLEDYGSLKAMAVRPAPNINNETLKTQIRPVPIERNSVATAFTQYLAIYGAFAVGEQARSGDIVALVETLGIPIVLRPVESNLETFKFVSCAWLFSSTWEARNGEEQNLKDKLSDVFPWIVLPHDEKELFEIH